MKKKILIIVLLILIISAAALLLIMQNVNSKVLNVGVRTDIADWAVYDREHESCFGIEADISEALAEKLGYSGVHYIPVNDRDGREKLRDGEIDCLIFAYPQEGTAEDDLTYSKSYFTSASYLICKTTTMFSSLEDLSGRPVGVISTDTVVSGHLLSAMDELGLEAPVLHTVDDYHELADFLETGEISAACVSDEITYSLLVDDCRWLEPSVGVQYAATAVRKDDPTGNAIIEAMNALIDDGSIDAVLDEWGWLF